MKPNSELAGAYDTDITGAKSQERTAGVIADLEKCFTESTSRPVDLPDPILNLCWQFRSLTSSRYNTVTISSRLSNPYPSKYGDKTHETRLLRMQSGQPTDFAPDTLKVTMIALCEKDSDNISMDNLLNGIGQVENRPIIYFGLGMYAPGGRLIAELAPEDGNQLIEEMAAAIDSLTEQNITAA